MSSLAATIEPQATYADLLAIPEPLVAEILCGELHTHPRPTPSHAVTSSSIGDELVSPFHKGRGGPGGGWILDEPEMHLGEHVLVPDLAGWCRERLPKIPETAYFELALDWVCEVLSPSTARTDRVLKLPIYVEFGVAHCWLVDPKIKLLEAFALQDGQWTLLGSYGGNDEIRVAPFDAITFPLSALWAE